MYHSLTILSLVLIALIIPINCQQNPTISFISKEKVVNIGDPLDLQCEVQYARDYPVNWKKVGAGTGPGLGSPRTLFISTGTSILVPDSRYGVRYDPGRNIYNLTMSKVQETDAGKYECEIVTGAASKVSADVMVYVRIPPVISDNSTRSVITTVGANVRLQCYASGFPQPQISWRREKNELLPNGAAYYRGNILEIRNITKDARGTYYCVADNGVSPGARRAIGVEVEFPPYIDVGRGRWGQALQFDADLHCHVEAFPSPSITWIKDGMVLNDNKNYMISIFSRSDEFTDTTLRVRRIEKKQYGIYYCRASNKLNTTEKAVELFETVNVICPPACGFGFSASGSTPSTTIPSTLLLIPILAYFVFTTRAIVSLDFRRRLFFPQ